MDGYFICLYFFFFTNRHLLKQDCVRMYVCSTAVNVNYDDNDITWLQNVCMYTRRWRKCVQDVRIAMREHVKRHRCRFFERKVVYSKFMLAQNSKGPPRPSGFWQTVYLYSSRLKRNTIDLIQQENGILLQWYYFHVKRR
jgi:hypothetical protein